MKEKRVSDYSIKKALQQIDEEAYIAVLKELAEKKYESLKEEPWLVRKRKTIDYLLQKGYESDLVTAILKDFAKE